MLEQLQVVAMTIQGWVLITLIIFVGGFVLLNLIAFRWMRELSGGLDSQLSGLLPRFPMYAAVGGLVGLLGFTFAFNTHGWLISMLSLGLVAGLACGMAGAQMYREHLRKGIFMLVGGLVGGPVGGLIGGLGNSSMNGGERLTQGVTIEIIVALAGGMAGALLMWVVKRQRGEAAAHAVFDVVILMAGGLSGGVAAALVQGLMTWWLAGLTVAITVLAVVWLTAVLSDVLAGLSEFGFSGVVMGLGHGPVMGMEYGLGYAIPAGLAIALAAAMMAW